MLIIGRVMFKLVFSQFWQANNSKFDALKIALYIFSKLFEAGIWPCFGYDPKQMLHACGDHRCETDMLFLPHNSRCIAKLICIQRRDGAGVGQHCADRRSEFKSQTIQSVKVNFKC